MLATTISQQMPLIKKSYLLHTLPNEKLDELLVASKITDFDKDDIEFCDDGIKIRGNSMSKGREEVPEGLLLFL